MAQLVLIKNATKNAQVGDLVSVHKDGTIPNSSPGYKDLLVITVPETVKLVNALQESKRPEIRRYDKSGKIEALDGIQFVEVTEDKYKFNIDTKAIGLTAGMTSTILRKLNG